MQHAAARSRPFSLICAGVSLVRRLAIIFCCWMSLARVYCDEYVPATRMRTGFGVWSSPGGVYMSGSSSPPVSSTHTPCDSTSFASIFCSPMSKPCVPISVLLEGGSAPYLARPDQRVMNPSPADRVAEPEFRTCYTAACQPPYDYGSELLTCIMVRLRGEPVASAPMLTGMVSISALS